MTSFSIKHAAITVVAAVAVGATPLPAPSGGLPGAQAASGGGAVADRQQAGADKGRLKVRITGLIDDAMKPKGVLEGKGFEKSVTQAKFSVKVKPGRYTLVLKPTKSTYPVGPLKRGATAYPAAKRFKVQVRKGTAAVLEASYGAVVARNAVKAPSKVKKVIGEPGNPTAVVVRRSKKYVKGGYLTSGPTKALPVGLASKIVKVRKRGRKMSLSLRSVQVTEVVPILNPDFRSTLPAADGTTHRLGAALRRLGAAMSCSIGIGEPSTYIDPKLNELSWSATYPSYFAAEVGSEFSVGFSPFPAGRSFSCSGGAGISVPFSIPAGPVVIPMFYGGSLNGSVSVSNEGAAQGGFRRGVELAAGVDTRRQEGDEFYVAPPKMVGDEPTPVDVKLSFAASAPVFIGAGVDGLAAAKYEIGPKLSVDFYKNACQLGLTLEDSVSLEAFGFTDELYGAKRNIFGPVQMPPCLAMDPIVGEWADGDNGTWKIEQTGDDAFTATVVKDLMLGDCVALPVGSQRTITRITAGYETTFQEFDSFNCSVRETDQKARITVGGDSLSWCGSGERVSGCRSYTREGSDPEGNSRAVMSAPSVR